MKRWMGTMVVLAVSLALSAPGWALDITGTNDADMLMSAIVGSAGTGITITNVSYSGHVDASGTYTAGPQGITDGALITTGKASIALPPNTSGSAGFNQGRAGDPLCNPLTYPHTSYDANKLVVTFDLDAGYDGISMLFIFGSEEYPEWVGSSYNDVFGVYLNGVQVAFDNSGAPVTINGPFFSGTNVVIPPANGTEYDGATPILQTKAPLAGGSTGNTLVFIVCDAGDHTYDSGAFISGLIGCVGDNCTGTTPCEQVDDDGDGYNACDDCDDSDPSIFPGAQEICDGLDNDCDTEVDEGNVCCQDIDLDGFCDEDDNCVSVYNPDQADFDLDGVGDACDPCPLIPAYETCMGLAGECMGPGDAYCADDATRMVCIGGALVEASCGQDYCTDDGTAMGGGGCDAADYYCSAGVCGSVETAGDDTCGGTAAAPSVTFYVCEGGNTCVALETVENDGCTDDGTIFGGGACAATDWTCAAGVLTVETSAGVDTCGEELVMPADLSTWTEESIGSANWVVSADKQSVLQGVNGNPTFFYSDYDAIGGTLTGTISVVNSADDDFIGFALGFQPGDTTNPDADYLLVDWKQGQQWHSPWGGYGHRGLAISRVTGVTSNTDFWSHTGVVQELQRGANLGSTGWQDYVEYEFRIEFGATHVRVWVNDALELDVYGDFNDGRFGFYNLSQAYVSYAGLASIPVLEVDSPKVAYYACQDGNTCVAAETVMTDSCVDNGTSYGGGACAATDWICTDGVLASTSISVTDSCGGTAASPSVTYYTCVAANGVVVDTCLAASTAENDSCADTGGAFGGGVCAAMDWDCVGGVLASNSTSGTDTCGGDADAPSVTYFACEGGNTCAALETVENDVCTDDGTAYGGGACSATDWTCAAGVLASTDDSGADTCGGTADAPSVTYYVCSAGDGTVADKCDALATAETDNCADSGTAFGGGSCAADDWDCEAGVLALNATSGTDMCGGDADAPNVTFWSCSANDGAVADQCLSAVTQEQDVCVDTGTPSGGGTCGATDWVCADAVLGSTSSEGVDTCGDGSDNQLYYYVCDAADGVADDLCVQVMDETPPEVAVVLAEQAVLDDGLVVYQVYCDVTDVCDDNPTYSSLIETPSPEGLAQKLKTKASTLIKFNLSNAKLDIFAPAPEAVLADLYEGGIPIDDGQSVTIKTHAGETYQYMYKVQEGISLIELKGPWVRLWCFGEDDAGHTADAYWEEIFHPGCGCKCQCDCPAGGECDCNCICENAGCNCECSGEGDCTCAGDGEEPCEGSDCNQGVGNGDEDCDPGNSNQGDDDNSNDENGGAPGTPGKSKK